jgi:hypothetical protein
MWDSEVTFHSVPVQRVMSAERAATTRDAARAASAATAPAK